MANFYRRETDDGFTFLNLESISHAEYVEDAKSLAITLVDGFAVALRGQEAADVVEFLRKNQFHPYRGPTAEQIAGARDLFRSLGLKIEECQNGEGETE